MAFLNVAVAFAMLCTVQCLVIEFKDCGSKIGKPLKVDISPCKVQPCSLVKGTNASINVYFQLDVAVSKLKVVLKGIIFGETVPFPVPHDQPCSYAPSKLKCPLKPGKQLDYQLVLPVQKAYPQLKLLVSLSLVNEENKDTIFCVMMPVQITN